MIFFSTPCEKKKVYQQPKKKEKNKKKTAYKGLKHEL